MPSKVEIKRYVMIGAPVTSVRTPPLLEAFLREQGYDARVETLRLEPADLASFMAEMRADPGIDGLMVTMPHKRALAPLLDGVSTVACRSGGVNAREAADIGRAGRRTVRRHRAGPGAAYEGRAAGRGGRAADRRRRRRSRHCASPRRPWLPAARRRRNRLRSGAMRHSPICATMDFSMRRPLAMPPRTVFEILVNATPLGMRPDDPSPFDDALVARSDWIADIVADPPRTRLADLAKRHRRKLVTGREMVESQVAPIGLWLLDGETEQAPLAGRTAFK